MSFDVRNTTRGVLPRILFDTITRAILGASYSLSLVLCSDTLARRLNREHRKKSYTPNVLSFPLSPLEGEIFLNIREAEREAFREGVSPATRIAYLFIHACLHLKGMNHGDAMDTEERRHMKKAGLPDYP